MRKTMKIQYDPADIPKLKDELDIMMIQIRAEAYDKGVHAEREQIIALLQHLRKSAQDKKLSQMVHVNALITMIRGLAK